MYMYMYHRAGGSSDVGIRRGRGLSHISNLTPHLPMIIIHLVVTRMRKLGMLEMRAIMRMQRGWMAMVPH